MARTSSVATQYALLIAGILLLGAAGTGLWFHGNDAWKLWQMQHAPAPAAGKTAPPKPSSQVMIKTYSYVGGEVLGLFLGIALIFKSTQKETESGGEATPSAGAAAPVETPVNKPKKVAATRRWQTCNVLEPGLDKRRLWTFASTKGGFSLVQEKSIAVADPLPAKDVVRSWQNLLQPKLNIAWLPVGQVFLRVLQLPAGEADELNSMVELQLEKISPLPVTQIVWAMEVLPQKPGNLQTVVVVIVARDVVESYLGQLEAQGFLPNRLEFPLLDQILGTTVREDGAYLFPNETPGAYSAIVAWWSGGVLKELGLLHFEAGADSASQLREQLSQMAWSGQLDGWLENTPRWHIVANPPVSDSWQALFAPWSDRPAAVIPALSGSQLAISNATRAARLPENTGILPFEHVVRYYQEFHDRLWMGGLFVLVGVYVLYVIGYMMVVQFQGLKADELEMKRGSLATQYTNTMKIKAQLEILQNREALKYAALDCWKVVAQYLPDGATIESMNFRDGKVLELSGQATADKSDAIIDFNANLRKALLKGGQMFERVDLPQTRLNPGNVTMHWSFNCELARVEELR